MVERLNGIEKVRGSTPLISTIPKCVQNNHRLPLHTIGGFWYDCGMKTKTPKGEVIAVARPTLLCAMPTLALSVVMMAVAGVFALCNRQETVMLSLSLLVLFVALFAGLAAVVRAWIASICNKYTFTTQVISARTGFLSTHTVEVKITDIRGISITRSLLGRILGYATAEIGSAATAGAEVRIANVRNLDAILAKLDAARA